MKIEKLNNGFYKLGNDEYRVEAPRQDPSGKKLRSKVSIRMPDGTRKPNLDEPEPTLWHLFKMTKGDIVHGEQIIIHEYIDDNFTGTADEAIAICEAHKKGA